MAIFAVAFHVSSLVRSLSSQRLLILLCKSAIFGKYFFNGAGNLILFGYGNLISRWAVPLYSYSGLFKLPSTRGGY